jgi:signal transduction histidine kinase
MLLSVGVMTLIGSITNLILPLFVGSNELARYGTYSTLIFVGLIAYAMLRRGLFDIRSAIARTLGYSLTLLFVFGSYWLISSLILSLTENRITPDQLRFVLLAFALFTAVVFQPVKVFFDKITNRIFFRDSYDPQIFLDELGDDLIAGYQLTELKERVRTTLIRHLKVSICEMIIDSQPHLTKPNARHVLLGQLVNAHQVFPLVSSQMQDDHLRRKLLRAGVGGIFKMETKSGVVGYVIVGEKKGGSAFSHQDVQTISIAMDETALAIENALRFEEIEDLNTNLQQKIEYATKELVRSNQKLKALDEAKDEFISMASHQLRTPLTSIKGYLSMVLEGDVGHVSPEQEKMLSQAFTSAQRMVYLIADLLNVSRLQTGKFVIEPKDTYLPDVVAEELAQLKESIASKNITLTYDKPSEFSHVLIDETKIRQVIMNFSDNALYYTPMGGSVHVELRDKRESIEFLVTDNGIGVPKAEQHKLFAKFYRAGNARKARPDGTGLGLFMAKKVIIASGGALIFRSKEGKGSTFGFTFPKSRVGIK